MKKNVLSRIIASVSIICSLTLSTLGLSFAHELDDIRAAIKAKGAKWSAGETSVSKLSEQEKKKRTGVLTPAVSAQPQPDTLPNLLYATTGTYDWRNMGGNNYVTTVKDQGSCGDCWAFATTAALESFTLVNGTFNTGLDLSEQVLVSCSGAGSCSGGYIDQASNYFLNPGLPAETYYPYTQTNGTCANATSGWQNSSNKIPAWHWVSTTSPTVSTIKNALYTYGPLVTTMSVYGDFFSYQSGIYSYSTGSYAGGHGVLIVGYTDDTTVPGGGYFTVKNSWGTGWGESGYFRIAYSELNSVVKFGYYTISYNATGSTPQCSYSVSPSSKTFSSSGGYGTITVTAASSCDWTAAVESGSSWINITSGSTGTGTGYVAYTVAPGTSSRTGSITIKNGNTVTIYTFKVSQQKSKGR